MTQFTPEQINNAAMISLAGSRIGASPRDVQIALMTALVESNLRNVNYGDRDSLGLFQQRPSQGWGTPEQVMNPAYAATQFFQHLMALGQKRYQMSMGQAAQAVQRSAGPDRYQQRLAEVRQLWPSVQVNTGQSVKTVDGNPYPVEQQTGIVNPADLYTPQAAPQQTGQVDVGLPSANTMLGAWGMDSAQPAAPVDFNDGTQTILSQATNQQVIHPLMQTTQSYAKGTDGWRRAVIDAARSALGVPYTWGGNSLSSGVDCSGLVQQAYAKAGISLPRISYAQANSGQRVGYGGLQPGDLIAWDNSPRNPGADHIAIYVGNGQIIEAPRPGLAVRIRSIGKNLDGGWGVHMDH